MYMQETLVFPMRGYPGCAEWVQREVAEYKLHAIKDISFSFRVGGRF